ncbi:hypothetical protein NBRC116597_09710 [Phaeobacter sp. NW0010-22]
MPQSPQLTETKRTFIRNRMRDLSRSGVQPYIETPKCPFHTTRTYIEACSATQAWVGQSLQNIVGLPDNVP